MYQPFALCVLGLFVATLAGCSAEKPAASNANKTDVVHEQVQAGQDIQEMTIGDEIANGLWQEPTAEEDTEVLKKFKEKGWSLRRDILINNGDQVVTFNYDGQLTDEDFDEIVKSKTISFLDLARNSEPTDEALSKLPQLTTLKRVMLGGEKMTDEGLKALANCPNLDSVIIMDSKNITGEGIAALAGLKNLKLLWIVNFPSSGECFTAFEGRPELRSLHVEGASGLTDAAAEHIAKIPNLEDLEIDTNAIFKKNETFTRKGIETIVNGRLPKRFKVTPTLVDDELFIAMLEKGWTPAVTGGDPPARPEELSVLNLRGYAITEKGLIAALERFKQLKSIDLTGVNISDEVFGYLKEQRQLSHLTLGNANISGEGLGRLADLPINMLSIDKSELTEEHFKSLGKIKSVTWLSLSDSQFDPVWLQHIQDLPNLAELYVTSSAFDDSGAEYVAKIPNLKELSVSYTSLTDKGLEILVKAPKLETIRYASGAKTTKDGIDRIKAEHPGISIY